MVNMFPVRDRAKSRKTKEWVNGYFYQGQANDLRTYIIFDGIWNEVYPDTFETNTGFKDRYNETIFTDNIVEIAKLRYVVEYCREFGGFMLKAHDREGVDIPFDFFDENSLNSVKQECIEIVGDIHDKKNYQKTCKRPLIK